MPHFNVEIDDRAPVLRVFPSPEGDDLTLTLTLKSEWTRPWINLAAMVGLDETPRVQPIADGDQDVTIAADRLAGIGEHPFQIFVQDTAGKRTLVHGKVQVHYTATESAGFPSVVSLRNLDGELGALEARLASGETETATVVSALDVQAGELAVVVSTLDTQAAELATALSAFERLSVPDPLVIDALSTNVSSLITSVDLLETDVADIDAALQTQVANSDVLSTALSSLDAQVTGLGGQVTALTLDVESHDVALSSLNNEVGALQLSVQDAASQPLVNSLQATVNTLQAELDALRMVSAVNLISGSTFVAIGDLTTIAGLSTPAVGSVNASATLRLPEPNALINASATLEAVSLRTPNTFADQPAVIQAFMTAVGRTETKSVAYGIVRLTMDGGFFLRGLEFGGTRPTFGLTPVTMGGWFCLIDPGADDTDFFIFNRKIDRPVVGQWFFHTLYVGPAGRDWIGPGGPENCVWLIAWPFTVAGDLSQMAPTVGPILSLAERS